MTQVIYLQVTRIFYLFWTGDLSFLLTLDRWPDISTYTGQVTRVLLRIDSKKEADKLDEVAFGAGLIEESVQHATAEHLPCSEGKTEDVDQAGAHVITQLLQTTTNTAQLIDK